MRGTFLNQSKKAQRLAAHAPNIDNACYVPTDPSLREIQAYKTDDELWKDLSGRIFALGATLS